MNFTLHPQLAADTISIGDLKTCRVLLMNNHTFPWLILVPMRDNMRELFDLSETDYHGTMSEVRHVSEQFAKITDAHKINVAAIGNAVPQLHIHIIARYAHDAAWPQPVWGYPAQAQTYKAGEMKKLKATLSRTLAFDLL